MYFIVAILCFLEAFLFFTRGTLGLFKVAPCGHRVYRRAVAGRAGLMSK